MSDFDRELIGALDAPDESAPVNPWHRPILLITWGILLTTVNLNFNYLQYILPTVGMALMYLGFRALRGENRHFMAAFIISSLRAAAQAILVIGNAASSSPVFHGSAASIAFFALQILQLVYFRLALGDVFTKCGAEKNTGAVTRLIWFTVSFGVLGVVGFSGEIVPFIYLAFYVAAVMSTVKISGSLSGVGYSMVTAPVRVGDVAAFVTYTVGTALVTLAVLVGSSVTLGTGNTAEAAGNLPLRESLVENGFPDYVLKDLDDETVAQFEGFVKITSVYGDCDYTKGVRLMQEQGDIENSSKYLRLTTVYVEVENKLVYTVNHFMWLKGGPVWGDFVEIYGDDNVVYSEDSFVAASVLYEKGGVTCASALEDLSAGYAAETSFFGSYTTYTVTGFARFPVGCSSARGYVVTSGTAVQYLALMCNVFNYYNMRFPAYPRSTDADRRRMVQNYTVYDIFGEYYDVASEE